MNYVIIGNSVAAVTAVSSIRENDKEGKITVISSENHHVYSRPLISYLLLGKVNEEKMKYRNDDFYKDNSCELLLGKTAKNIDNENKVVVLDDGKNIPYDKLLIATGSSPIIPPIEGLDSVKNKFSFMTLDDANAIQSVINKDSKVLILGAGLIGLKCAEGIANQVKKVTVVDMSDKILSSILDDNGAKIMQTHIESKGIEFILNKRATRFENNVAYLEDEKVEFDVLVLAVGVRANTSLLKDIGGEVNRGIIVNNKMETSINDIYAAGDCVELLDISSNENKVLALLPNAYMGGECAGSNMSGTDKTFNNAIPMNAIGFFGLNIITAGNYIGDDIIQKNCDNNKYKRLFYKDDNLCGYILIGDIDKAGIYTSLIREKTPLSSIDFELVCEKPTLLAFSKKERNKKLGGKK